MRWIVLVLGGVLAATYVSPAVGGPDLAGQLRRVDQREQRHYDSIDRRIKATVALIQLQAVTTTVSTGVMVQSTDGRYFRGSASCVTGRLVGGGVDWGTATVYSDYHVISSSPDPGATSWKAEVNAGGSPVPSGFPQVYAVCATI
jgi:hypothetical protein